MIQAKDIHKYYDQLHVLKGVDLHIKKGDVFLFLFFSATTSKDLLR